MHHSRKQADFTLPISYKPVYAGQDMVVPGCFLLKVKTMSFQLPISVGDLLLVRGSKLSKVPVTPEYLASDKKSSDMTHSGWSRAIKTMVAESCSATEQARGMAVITLGWGMGYVLPCAVGQDSVLDCILETCCGERRDGGRFCSPNASASDLTTQVRLSGWLSAQKNLRV